MDGPVVPYLTRAVPTACFQCQKSLALSGNDINEGEFMQSTDCQWNEAHCGNRTYKDEYQDILPQNKGCYSMFKGNSWSPSTWEVEQVNRQSVLWYFWSS